MNKLEEIFQDTIIDVDAFFHLLKHFIKLDNEFKEWFTKKTHYKVEDIQLQMDKPGSKFRYSFAKNPEELIKNLAIQVDYKSFYISDEGNKTEISIEFDHEVFPKGIGFDGIAAIRNLEDIERSKITEIERNNYQIKRIETDKKRTWKLNLNLHKTEDKYLIADFSPGIYAPPYPNKEVQSEKQLSKSIKFWEEHVLLG